MKNVKTFALGFATMVSLVGCGVHTNTVTIDPNPALEAFKKNVQSSELAPAFEADGKIKADSKFDMAEFSVALGTAHGVDYKGQSTAVTGDANNVNTGTTTNPTPAATATPTPAATATPASTTKNLSYSSVHNRGTTNGWTSQTVDGVSFSSFSNNKMTIAGMTNANIDVFLSGSASSLADLKSSYDTSNATGGWVKAASGVANSPHELQLPGSAKAVAVISNTDHKLLFYSTR